MPLHTVPTNDDSGDNVSLLSFSRSDSMPVEARLSGEIDLAGFRSEARDLLAQQVPPENVRWEMPTEEEWFAEPQAPAASRPRSVARAATAIVPASFLRLCESVVLHRDPQRFALLYRLLWRLVHEPGLRNDPADPDMQHAQHMAHAVRRDIHKMKTYVRFVPMRAPGAKEDEAPLHLAWFEPTHHIVELVAQWFAKRQPDFAWAIVTPERTVRWDGSRLHYARGVPREDWPANEQDAAGWLACCEAAFVRA